MRAHPFDCGNATCMHCQANVTIIIIFIITMAAFCRDGFLLVSHNHRHHHYQNPSEEVGFVRLSCHLRLLRRTDYYNWCFSLSSSSLSLPFLLLINCDPIFILEEKVKSLFVIHSFACRPGCGNYMDLALYNQRNLWWSSWCRSSWCRSSWWWW